jgi:hypothetical protein
LELSGTTVVPKAVLNTDNQAAIKIATNESVNPRSKHIDIKYHFIKDEIKKGTVSIRWIPTEDQEADILTKALPRLIFERLRRKLLASV